MNVNLCVDVYLQKLAALIKPYITKLDLFKLE